jgi:hypothetical protein
MLLIPSMFLIPSMLQFVDDRDGKWQIDVAPLKEGRHHGAHFGCAGCERGIDSISLEKEKVGKVNWVGRV